MNIESMEWAIGDADDYEIEEDGTLGDGEYDFEGSETGGIWAGLEIAVRTGDDIKRINAVGEDPFVFEDEKMGWEDCNER